MLTKDQIRRYQEIHHEIFGEEIPYDLAAVKATNLVNFMGLLYRPFPVEQYREAERKFAMYSQRRRNLS